MRVLENNFGWNPIETAPLDEDVSLEVADGRRYGTGSLTDADLPRQAGSVRARARRSRSRR